MAKYKKKIVLILFTNKYGKEYVKGVPNTPLRVYDIPALEAINRRIVHSEGTYFLFLCPRCGVVGLGTKVDFVLHPFNGLTMDERKRWALVVAEEMRRICADINTNRVELWGSKIPPFLVDSLKMLSMDVSTPIQGLSAKAIKNIQDIF